MNSRDQAKCYETCLGNLHFLAMRDYVYDISYILSVSNICDQGPGMQKGEVSLYS
jgi:hypothetical protein